MSSSLNEPNQQQKIMSYDTLPVSNTIAEQIAAATSAQEVRALVNHGNALRPSGHTRRRFLTASRLRLRELAASSAPSTLTEGQHTTGADLIVDAAEAVETVDADELEQSAKCSASLAQQLEAQLDQGRLHT